MTNLDNYTFESIVREMTVGMNEYNELVYATAKVVTELCSPKKKRKVNARNKPSWKQKIQKEIEHLRRELSILSELEKSINVKGKMCRNLMRKYKLNKENITRVKVTVKQRMQLNTQRMRRYEKRGKFYRQNLLFKNDVKKSIERLETKK